MDLLGELQTSSMGIPFATDGKQQPDDVALIAADEPRLGVKPCLVFVIHT